LHVRAKGKEHPDTRRAHGQGSPRCALGAVRSQAIVASRRRRSPRTILEPAGRRERTPRSPSPPSARNSFMATV